MLAKLRQHIFNMITEPNNVTACPIRIMGIFGALYGLGAHAYGVFVQHVVFDLQSFGIGLGTILTTLGVALGIKKDSQ